MAWGVPPAATKSFVLIADDPDAPGGTWVHWVIHNLSLDLRGHGIERAVEQSDLVRASAAGHAHGIVAAADLARGVDQLCQRFHLPVGKAQGQPNEDADQ